MKEFESIFLMRLSDESVARLQMTPQAKAFSEARQPWPLEPHTSRGEIRLTAGQETRSTGPGVIHHNAWLGRFRLISRLGFLVFKKEIDLPLRRDNRALNVQLIRAQG